MPFGGGSRWIEVAPSGADTPIAICPPGPNVTAGDKDTGISLQNHDIDAYHAQLKDRGVDVDAEVSRFGEAPPLFWFRSARQEADWRPARVPGTLAQLL